MEDAKAVTVKELKAQIEEAWSLFDELFEILDQSGGWDGKHGKDWTFADVPYHLAYFDYDVVIEPIKAGADVPEDQRWELRSGNEIDAWNQGRFAERPKGQSVGQTLEQLSSTRNELRDVLAGMSDAELDGKVWLPLGTIRGWRTVKVALEICRNHTMSEFVQLRTLMKREEPAPSAGLTHSWLSGLFGLLGTFANPDAIGDRPFTMIWNIVTPGGGPWTIHVEGGDCTITEGHGGDADLEMSLTPQYLGVLVGAQNPIMGLLTRKIRIRGFRHLRTMGKLFSPPKPDEILEPVEAI